MIRRAQLWQDGSWYQKCDWLTMPNSAKHITLCADDYALHKTVSEGIIHLAQKGRINAVNCLTTTPYWKEHAKWLHPYRNQLDIGLHFNLTEGKPLSSAKSLVTQNGFFRPLTAWLLQAHLRQVTRVDIENELSLQLAQFTHHFKRQPDFIDSHQYVHHFPVVREALLNVYERELKKHHPYIRVSKQCGGGVKPWIVTTTGAKVLERQLSKKSIPHNTSFSGIYPFGKAERYRLYFMRFLKNIADGGVIVCHPGFHAPQNEVLWAKTRAYELAYLEGNSFTTDCDEQGVRLGRFLS